MPDVQSAIRKHWRPHPEVAARVRSHHLHEVPKRGALEGARPAVPLPRVQVSVLSQGEFVSLKLSRQHDSVECARKATAEEFPRNFALIRLAERAIER